MIAFATSNKLKFLEAAAIIPGIEPLHLHIPEVQETDVMRVVADKLNFVSKAMLDHAVIVEDTGLYISSWNRLPGALIKWFVDELGTKRLAEIVLADRENATVEAISAVGVWYRGESQVFSGRTAGRIVLPCGDELGWNTIFYYPPSQKTFGEMSFDERLKVSMRRAPLIEAGKWLAERGADAEE